VAPEGVVSGNPHAPGRRPNEAGKHLQRRRFPRTVSPNKTHNLALLKLKINSRNGYDIPRLTVHEVTHRAPQPRLLIRDRVGLSQIARIEHRAPYSGGLWSGVDRSVPAAALLDTRQTRYRTPQQQTQLRPDWEQAVSPPHDRSPQ